MQHELSIKDSRGEIRIVVNLYVGVLRNDVKYSTYVMHKAPRKKKEVSNQSIATDAEIYAAKLELWNKLHPSLTN